jgi:hypothetical protein
MFEVIEVKSRRDLRDFIGLPYRLYRGDPNYVPPLRTQIKDMLTGPDNMLFGYGPHILLLCRQKGRCVGRILAGVDKAYNLQNGYQSAWFSLFDCEKDEAAAATLIQACADWARNQGVDTLRGPEAPDNGDSYKGILVMGFDGPPAMMNSYNPPWYGEFLEKQGFVKSHDLYAYSFSVRQIVQANNERVIQYAMKKYGYHVDPVNLNNLEHDFRDMHTVLLQTIPTFPDEHMTVPSLADFEKTARGMLSIADPDIVCIARTDLDDRPIGVVVGLPDYNRVFRHIRDGRLFPFGFFKLLYYRRRIDAVRVFMQFVVPDYQRKAVNNAIFYKMCQAAVAKGYLHGDGSTIGETNLQSRSSVERLGGEHYRTYRIYKKKL